MELHIFIWAKLISQDGKLLLVHDQVNDHNTLPGGKLPRGEQPLNFIRSKISQVLSDNAFSELNIVDVFTTVDSQRGENIHVVYNTTVIASATKNPASTIWSVVSDLDQENLENLTRLVLMRDKQEVVPQIQFSPINSHNSGASFESLVIFSDGASRGNPGPSAAGFVVFDTAGKLIFKEGKYLGVTTNNQAEYQAVKLALEKAVQLGANTIAFNMDSLLVVNQLSGLYQIKNRDLWPIHTSVKELVAKFRKVQFQHVPRELNKEADHLVNEVLDAHAKQKYSL